MVRFGPTVVGILLAAGGGTRMGRPKALVIDEEGSWLLRACTALSDGGCDEVHVVVGASASQVRELLGAVQVNVVEAVDWADGMGASLRAGLVRASVGEAEAALVHLVDLPDVGPDVVRRVMIGVTSHSLVRAVYGGMPGHPVLVGREHWAGVVREVIGDEGARDYLERHNVVGIECSDLATGRDIDRPTTNDDHLLDR